jgi:hypothetical protein
MAMGMSPSMMKSLTSEQGQYREEKERVEGTYQRHPYIGDEFAKEMA